MLGRNKNSDEYKMLTNKLRHTQGTYICNSYMYISQIDMPSHIK